MSKSKICIVTPRSINDSPCLEKYKAILSEPFDLIYWAKGEADHACGAENYYPYSGEVSVEGGKLSKLKHYYRLTKFAKRTIRENQYEKLIVYPTHMAWLLRGLLRRSYRGKYLLDIRDYAGENHRIIGRLTAEAVENAGLCTITSPAYARFLPGGKDYVISHNLQPIDEALIRRYRTRGFDRNRPIVLSFIGTVRFLSQQKRLISLFGNDERFHLKYVGRGSEALKPFCEAGNYRNVTLIGQFPRNELGRFYMDTDMAINVYGNDSPALICALSNKLYSAALMGMPVLASPNTYTAEIVTKYQLGFALDMDCQGCVEQLYDYFQKLDREALLRGCDAFMEQVLADESLYRKTVAEFLLGGADSDFGEAL